MDLPPLQKCTIVKRYKRFLIDVKLEDDTIVTAHCPNSGSMLGLNTEGLVAYVSLNNNPKNKLQYKLQLVEDKTTNALVGINTSITNSIVKEALLNQQIEELKDYNTIIPESTFLNSRFDFKLISKNNDICYLEVKNVTLRNDQIALFPDAVTDRGSKHLKCLIEAKKHGFRAINLYIIQREDTTEFAIAKEIDIKYYNNYLDAKKSNVEFLCYSCNMSLNNITINNKLRLL